MFYKKGVLKNLAKFTEKHLFHSLFLNEIVDSSLQLYKKRDSDCEFCEVFKNTFFHVSVRMRENAEKMRTRITPNTDTFYTVGYGCRDDK